MMGNVLLDIAVGAIPLLGDMFDVFFKANTANLNFWHCTAESRDSRSYPGSELESAPLPRVMDCCSVDVRSDGDRAWRFLLPIAVVLVAALTLLLIGLITIVRWLM